jgi:hypothetical protein
MSSNTPRRALLTGFLVGFLVVGDVRPAAAWGFEAHRFILDRAIALLPAELRPFFEKTRVAIVEHSIDPDLWRTVGWDAEEAPRHFLDMDAYGAPPFAALPRDRDAAVKKFGLDMINRYGLLPWRAQDIQDKLVEAFRLKHGYSRENVKLFSSVIGHYLSDAQVPFHASRNHDGQLTGQWGIHSRFETELFERYRDQLQIAPASLVKIASVRDYTFDSLIASYSHVQAILDADRAAVAGRDVYDDAYFEMLFAKLKPVLEARLASSITATASAITSAWEQAGKPAMPVEVPRVPRPVRRK